MKWIALAVVAVAVASAAVVAGSGRVVVVDRETMGCTSADLLLALASRNEVHARDMLTALQSGCRMIDSGQWALEMAAHPEMPLRFVRIAPSMDGVWVVAAVLK